MSQDRRSVFRTELVLAFGVVAVAAFAHSGSGDVAVHVAALRDPIAEVRCEAAEALARLGPAAVEAVPALIAVLSDADPGVRWHSSLALAAIGPGGAEPLVRALGGTDPATRAGADGTRVNFFLVAAPDANKTLIELYEPAPHVD